MSVKIVEERPPFVAFEVIAQENHRASREAGHYVAEDVDFAIITPPGSRDTVYQPVKDWFGYITKEVERGRFKVEWLNYYKHAYEEWKKGNEIPVNGSPIKNWPVISPAQVAMLLKMNIRTVEDLAQCNEEAIRYIGMGARSLKQKAIDWLTSASNTGKLAEEMTALRAENEDLKAANKALDEKFNELLNRLSVLESGPVKLRSAGKHERIESSKDFLPEN